MKKLYILVASNTLIDLAFFASIPYLFLQYIIHQKSHYLELACVAALVRGVWYMITLHSLEDILRSQHETLSRKLFEGALSFSSPHHRLNINAEITNYIYGRVYNSAMLLAETSVILLYGVAITYFLGAKALVFLSVLAVTIAPILLLSRKRAMNLASERISSEEQRQVYVNVVSGYPLFLKYNGTTQVFVRNFMNYSSRFSGSLAKIAIIPQKLKLSMEVLVTLTFAVAIYVGTSEFNLETGSIILGLSLRLLPALSRVASLLEGVRVNSLSFSHIQLSLAPAQGADYQFVDKSIEIKNFVNHSTSQVGMLVGKSGVGKTSSLNKALTQLVINSDLKIKYFPQAASLDKLLVSEVRELFSRNVSRLKSIDADVRYETLSGGQKSSLLLDLVFGDAVDLVVLDEPTTGLDEKLVDDLIQKIKGSPSRFLIISHDAYFRSALDEAEVIDFND